MKTTVLLSIVLMQASVIALASQNLELGDGRIDGGELRPYKHSWRQCSYADGKWQAMGALSEELMLVGDSELQQRQVILQPDGSLLVSDAFYDRRSFAPLRISYEVTRDGAAVALGEWRLDEHGYTGHMVRGEAVKELKGKINSKMLNGAAMGLPLSTLEFQAEPIAFSASMLSFDGTYDVVATWVGKETLAFEGDAVETWMIDVEWHHLETGDVYPPGPNASGGRYWVVRNPPPGFPYVPRYQTDTYNVEFIAEVCPE